MAQAATTPVLAVKQLPGARYDRVFYSGMAVALLLSVFVGFAPTYYLSSAFDGPSLVPLTHLHGAVFSLWVVLFLVQTSLVAGHRVALHRKLGVFGAVLAGSMFVLGVSTAIGAAARGGGVTAPPEIPALAFLAVPLFDMAVFGPLVALAILWRRDKEWHKRLMLVAYITITTAAIARWPGVLAMGPPVFFGITNLFLLAGVAYDYWSRRKVHPAYIWAGAALVISQPLRLVVSGTETWMSFARWVTGAA